MKQQELSVLANVIAVARRELADRDELDVPNKLKKVSRSAAKTLPLPFRSSLIDVIRTSEVFRESVLERWEDEGIDDPIGGAFLADPQAGAHLVAEQAMSLDVDALRADLEKSNGTIRSLEDQLEESKRRLTEARAARKDDLARRDAAAATSRESLERNVRTLQLEVDGFDEERQGLLVRLANTESEIEDLKAKLKRSTDREMKRAKDQHISVRQVATPPSDPLELAAWLDNAERSQRPYREPDRRVNEVEPRREPVRFPKGLAPDSPEALSALVAQGPDVFYVDGYNVAGQIADHFHSSTARSTVTAKAGRLAAAAGARVVVLFDAVGVEGRETITAKGPVEVHFTKSQIADDVIVEAIIANPSRAVVISSDRELNNRCAAAGCVTLWSEAFIGWAGG